MFNKRVQRGDSELPLINLSIQLKESQSCQFAKLFQIFIVLVVLVLLLGLTGRCYYKHVIHRSHSDHFEVFDLKLPPNVTDVERAEFMAILEESSMHLYFNNDTASTMRFGLYKENKIGLEKLRGENPNTLFALNKFAIMTNEELESMLIPDEEFEQEMVMLKGNKDLYESAPMDFGNVARPPSFDWRTKGKISRVKDQGQCGSCWAFSVTALVEAQFAIQKNELVELSEQQLVDCEVDNRGCHGGVRQRAFDYVRDYGLTLEKLYYYAGKEQQCKNITANLHKIRSYRYLMSNEDSMADYLVNTGPFSIGVDVTKGMYYYSSGVFSPSVDDCQNHSLGKHALLVVGYGQLNGEDFWIIKNSWGTSYGEDGYFKMRRGVNACGLANAAFGIYL